MTTTPYQTTGRPVSRDQFLAVLNSANNLGYPGFTRQAAVIWLAAFPGDLTVSLLYGQALLKEGKPEQAFPVLKQLANADPESLEIARSLLDVEQAMQQTPRPNSKAAVRTGSETRECVWALDEYTGTDQDLTPPLYAKNASSLAVVSNWSHSVRTVRHALAQNEKDQPKTARPLEQEIENLNPALAADPATPLVAVTHLRLMRALGSPFQSLRSLAEHYHTRWPECVQFQLLLAETLVALGETERGVAFLHRAAAGDVAGQVAERLWGQGHPFRSLWPTRMHIQLEILVPGAVANDLGWNQLSAGLTTLTPPTAPPKSEAGNNSSRSKSGNSKKNSLYAREPATKPAPPELAPEFSPSETLLSVQTELERLAQRVHQPNLARSDGRFPVYVIFTTRQGLEAQYGKAGAARLDSEMKRLQQAFSRHKDWHAVLYYADDGMSPDIAPARFNDAWALKLAVTDLDSSLRKKGQMIGALLIVGGPEVIPFHNLPNPVDDADHEVPSDNPYGTRDENYFIPEWPVGRLPGGNSHDPAVLQVALARLVDYHQSRPLARTPSPWYWELLQALLAWLSHRSDSSPAHKKKPSFGYTAAIWKQTSQLVFRPIGEARALRVSPPDGAPGDSTLPTARLGYFNLHGLIDAVEWFGQEDASEGHAGSSGLDYPVAVRPQDVVNSGRAPEVVFTEACYGAHILGKSMEDALALKFLQSGTLAVVGSTCTSYGSVQTPLTAADFLGHAFWDALRQGAPAGEALRRAKLSLGREMHRRQGYLDGEDQKTLVSFILYGDPLAQPVNTLRRESKSVLRPLRPPRGVTTICDRARLHDQDSPLPPEVNTYVRKIVEQYLPGMRDAHAALTQEHFECDNTGHNCPTGQLKQKTPKTHTALHPSSRRVVVLSKDVPTRGHIHTHYARLTLDDHNRLVKLVISR